MIFQSFKTLLYPNQITGGKFMTKLNFIVGAVDAITSRISCQMGADYIWASGFVMSCMLGEEDNGVADLEGRIPLIRSIIRGATRPVILDFDTGGCDAIERRARLRLLAGLPLGGVCIEDETYPKTNALLQYKDRNLVSMEEMASRIADARSLLDPKCLVIARTHSLIVGEPLSLLQERMNIYENAGSDIICIHYIGNSWEPLQEALRKVHSQCPIMIIPTTFDVPLNLLHELGVRFVLFPNQIYRQMLLPIFSSDSSDRFYESLVTKTGLLAVKEIFNLAGDINSETIAENCTPKSGKGA